MRSPFMTTLARANRRTAAGEGRARPEMARGEYAGYLVECPLPANPMYNLENLAARSWRSCLSKR